MAGEFVAIDLETTGFNSVADRIIEIAAVRFDRDGARDRFSTFVRPGRPIPPAIRMLTSISDADVADAPTPPRAVAELAVFLAGQPVVGHNVAFDLAFLAEAGLHIEAPAFDTLELASVLLPTATQLDLSSLAAGLAVEVSQRHRALPDAEATGAVLLRLLDRLEALPLATLRDLVRLAKQSGWGLGVLFDDALTRRGSEAMPDAVAPPTAGRLGSPLPRPQPAPLRPREDGHAPVTQADVERVFDEAMRRTDLLPGFEARAGQIAMAGATAGNIEHHGHLAVEAGTGTGKSLAYLVPALLHALRSGERVVVSTQTLNLQEQLGDRDLPTAAALVEAAEGVPPGALRSAVLKGRANYLCLERWTQSLEEETERSVEQVRLLARVAVWLDETESGDIAELYLRSEDRPYWRALAADTNDCLSRRCPFVREGSCFLQRSRAEAAAAHVVVTNHALLLVNAASDDQVLPPFRHLVIDEAQRLEAVATDQFGGSLSLVELGQFLDEVAASGRGASSLVSELLTAATLDPMPLSPAAGLVPLADDLIVAATRVRDRLPDLEVALTSYVEEFADRRGESRVLVTVGRRAQPLWADAEEAAMHVELTLVELVQRLFRVQSVVAGLPPDSAPALDALRGRLGQAADAAARHAETLRVGVLRADPELIVWLTLDGRGPRVHIAPLDVSVRLVDELYARRDSVLATSATLTTQGSFDFSMRRLGLLDPDTLDVGSSFNYERAVLAIVVEDLPEPDAPDYEVFAHRVLEAATRAAGGRTLTLFTSHGSVHAAAAALREPLAADGIALLAHDIDGGPARLLRALAERPRSLVLGTASFWEGVDVRGPALSQLVLARLPFPVPTDPIHAARGALHDDPFAEYTLPQAVLRFRQGFGRLIRGAEDLGVFLILDARVRSRDYGHAFLEALPPCEIRVLPSSKVSDAVAAWLAAPPACA